MPWLHTDPMEQRKLLVAQAAKGWSKSELAEFFGVSRKTVHKWLNRAEDGEGLEDQSRAPKSHPGQTPPEVVKRLIALRQQRPTWGARKLVAWLDQHEPWWLLPSPSTVTEILKRRGMVAPRRRMPRGTTCRAPFSEATAPNTVWAMDFKGEFRVGDGTFCYPLTVVDAYSRMALCCRGMTSVAQEPVERALERTFREWGMPERLRSDNGTPFGAKRMGPLSRLSVWLLKLGVMPEYIDPGSPHQNGRLERFHLTLKHETAFPPAASMTAQQRRFNRFIADYNDERPHEALGLLPPRSVHHWSPRPFPGRLEEPSYPGHYQIVRLPRTGGLSWKGASLFVSSALGGELVGIVEVDNGLRDVYFGPLRVGRIDERRRRAKLLPMFPV